MKSIMVKVSVSIIASLVFLMFSGLTINSFWYPHKDTTEEQPDGSVIVTFCNPLNKSPIGWPLTFVRFNDGGCPFTNFNLPAFAVNTAFFYVLVVLSISIFRRFKYLKNRF